MNIFQRAIQAGYSCFPCDGKRPALGSWKKYMTELPTLEEAQNWTGNIGVVCGAISGGLTCLDFDVKNGDVWDSWLFDVDQVIPETLSKLYMENTPSGGYHVVFRSKYSCRSKKLACNTEGMGMVETRGDGGYFVSAPSVGYSVYYGKLSGMEPITTTEAEILVAISEVPNQFKKPEYKTTQRQTVQGESVFDRYDSVNDPVQLLLSHGWTVAYSFKGKTYLRRPGKKEGVSATWNAIPNRFYCFSTSTHFENEKVYKASAVYAILEHGGNFRAACKELAKVVND